MYCNVFLLSIDYSNALIGLLLFKIIKPKIRALHWYPKRCITGFPSSSPRGKTINREQTSGPVSSFNSINVRPEQRLFQRQLALVCSEEENETESLGLLVTGHKAPWNGSPAGTN